MDLIRPNMFSGAGSLLAARTEIVPDKNPLRDRSFMCAFSLGSVHKVVRMSSNFTTLGVNAFWPFQFVRARLFDTLV